MKEKINKDDYYVCGFCGKEIVDKPTLTLSYHFGLIGCDIADICDECLKEIESKVILTNEKDNNSVSGVKVCETQ